MSKSSTLSPLKAIEEVLYQKVKDTPFQVWHYMVALAFLTVIPALASPFVKSDTMTFVVMAVMAGAWATSRVIGRNLSRNKAIDSVLVYRFFAAVPWFVSFAVVGVSLLVSPLDSLSRLLYQAVFCVSAVVAVMHVLGIVIHLRGKKKMVRNIKKEDLFQ